MVWALHLSSSAPGFPSAGCVAAHRRERYRRVGNLRPHGKKPASPGGGGGGEPSENAVLRLAWYGSELLGIAASFLRPSPPAIAADEGMEVVGEEGAGPAGRTQVVEAIKEDFQRSYFVTGNLTLNAYEEDCEFADPAATGYTEYYFNADSGKVFRHVEHWNVPKMALLKQIFRPTRWVWSNKRAS